MEDSLIELHKKKTFVGIIFIKNNLNVKPVFFVMIDFDELQKMVNGK